MEFIILILIVFILLCFCFISQYVEKTKVKMEELNSEIDSLKKELETVTIYKREIERIEYDKDIKSIPVDKMGVNKEHNYKVVGKKAPKILVGDYNIESARNTCGVLLRMGFDVEVLETAEDIIERIKCFKNYDLIITNNEYYGRKHKSSINTGSHLLSCLKELDDFNIPVVVLTVSSKEDELLKDGFNGYIQKLLDEEKVVNTFPSILKRIKFEKIKSNNS